MEISLYVVGTPIGNLGDFSRRGEEILRQVDAILCEDTRVTSKLLAKIGASKPLIVYNDHNAETACAEAIASMKTRDATYALVSDAGMPTVSDPGFKLIRSCIRHNLNFTVIPGPCAAINALILSGLPPDCFTFCGFAQPNKFADFAAINTTLIFYEAPQRIIATLQLMQNSFPDRDVAIAREMTKIHEEVLRGSFDFLVDHFSKNPPKGEFVIILSPREKSDELARYDGLASAMLSKFSASEVSKILARHTGMSRNAFYRRIGRK